MKPAIKIITLSFSLLLMFMVHLVFAETKTFIKEYTYQASDEDSKNSSRVIALREVKRLLLEELGTYLESETEVKNFQLTQDQITTLTAGIVQTEIVAEKWDGKVYWLKSKIIADSDKVVHSINDLRKDREKKRELEVIRKKSDELMQENERLRKELASVQDGKRDIQKAAYKKSINELSAADWLEKGHVANNSGDFKGAKEAYKRAFQLDPKNIMALYAHGIMSEGKERSQNFNTLLAIEARDSESHLARAWTYNELGKRDLANQEYSKAIEKAAGIKEKAKVYFDRGMSHYTHDIGNNEVMNLALQDFNRAIELDPKDSEKYNYRGSLYQTLNKRDLALQDFNMAIKLNPKDVFSYIFRGNTLIDKPELAIDSFNKAIELDPKEYTSYEYRAAANEKLGRLDLAIKDYSKALELRGVRGGTFIYNIRAALYARVGNHDLAIKDYSKTIKLNPIRLAYMDRGKYFATYDKHTQAIEDFTTVIKMNQDYEALVERGFSYFKLGRHDLALKDYNKAIALNYSYTGSVYYNRAMLYAQENNFVKAIQDLSKAIEDPYYKNKAQKEPQFDSLKGNPDFIKLIVK